MALRIVVAVGLTAHCLYLAFNHVDSILLGGAYAAVPMYLWLGIRQPIGLLYWPFASVLLVLFGHVIVGWLPIAVAAFSGTTAKTVLNSKPTRYHRKSPRSEDREPQRGCNMFGFGKKRLFRKMEDYVTTIQYAFYVKTFLALAEQYSEKESKRLAAAITNRIFAQPMSPMHAHLGESYIDKFAVKFLGEEEDQDMFYCSASPGIGQS